MRRFLYLTVLMLSAFGMQAQKLSLTGYVKDMQAYYHLENPLLLPDGSTFQSTTYNQIHNRLNLEYRPVTNLRFELGMRNRLLMGPMISDFPNYAGIFGADEGLVDLSWNLAEKNNWFMNTSLDRLYVDYTINKVQLRLGRQRINWGINLVWNPNDLFNAFSYLDFDYEERPGSDAALLTWYTSGSSSLDLAFQIDGQHRTTAAARYFFNLEDYDVQFIGGKNRNDWIVGGGWSGSIGKVSLRGEGTFFTPMDGKEDVSETAVSATLEADYTFTNDLYAHTAFLFNSSGTTSTTEGFNLLDPNYSLSAKNLSFGKYELFAQLSYPFNPILNGSVSGIFNPSDHSCYLGPTATISLQDNLELMLTAQLLLGEPGSEYGAMGNVEALFGRVRWSF